MARNRRGPPNFPTIKDPKLIDQYINEKLLQREEIDGKVLGFFKNYYQSLEQARNLRREEISSALNAVRKTHFTANLSRITHSRYAADPLCTLGSLLKQGSRFNMATFKGYEGFPALYLANSYNTAQAEYLQPGNSTLSAEEMSLEEPGSFLHVRVHLQLESYLDIREDSALEPFLKVISRIQPSFSLQCQAKSLKLYPLKTVFDLNSLRKMLFFREFKNVPTWLDMPSNSQWFGKHVMDAGIQGLIFPSVRNHGGYNIAVYTRNFASSLGEAKLLDDVGSVSEDRRCINAANYMFFENNKCHPGAH